MVWKWWAVNENLFQPIKDDERKRRLYSNSKRSWIEERFSYCFYFGFFFFPLFPNRGSQHIFLGRCYAMLCYAKMLQSCPTLCDPIDGSPSGSAIPGILQARTLEWVAIFFSSAWKWKVKVKLLSRARSSATPWTAVPGSSIHGDFPGKSTGVGCHCLLLILYSKPKFACYSRYFLTFYFFIPVPCDRRFCRSS